MVFCRGCAKEIHETAPTCPQCGAVQHIPAPPTPQSIAESPWMAITSLVLGIICVLALLDDSDWDKDTISGLGFFSVLGFVFGAISINKKKPGNNLAIAGVILSLISLLALIGLSN